MTGVNERLNAARYGEWVKVADYQALADALSEEPTRWIPVAERLPERYVDVLLSEGATIAIGFYASREREFAWRANGATALATHWMPLPEAPK